MLVGEAAELKPDTALRISPERVILKILNCVPFFPKMGSHGVRPVD